MRRQMIGAAYLIVGMQGVFYATGILVGNIPDIWLSLMAGIAVGTGLYFIWN